MIESELPHTDVLLLTLGQQPIASGQIDQVHVILAISSKLTDRRFLSCSMLSDSCMYCHVIH
jgi:hypothetical protein